jgi:diguanylate cyclase (GGDEF)-like protein
MLEVQRIDGKPVSLHIGRREFEVEEETGYVTVPKEFLTGFRLSDIPADIIIKPDDKIEGHTIHITNDVAFSQFSGGSASAAVEGMFRRKFWDGDTGLSPYVAALRQAVNETDQAAETDFDDDGDYIFLHYDILIENDFEIQEATELVDAAIQRIHQRADQLVTRKRDGLLGIFDRGSFKSDLTHALTGRLPVALVMVDIDHFKQVNDAFGHPVGDEVLRAVAKVLTSKCDGRHRLEYRYGGEELALILTGDDAARAIEVAESVRVDVEELRFHAYRDLHVTVSVGVGEVPREGSNNAELIRITDAALYLAKTEGRNRVRKPD